MAHLGLLMVERVELRSVRRVEEPHRGSRGVTQVAGGSRRRVDLSHAIHDGLVTYPGLPAPEITEHLRARPRPGSTRPG